MTTFLVKGHSTFFLRWFLSNESVGRALGLVIGKMIAEAVDKVGAAGGPDHELTQPIHRCHSHILESLVDLFISYSLHYFSRAISKFLFLIFLACSILFLSPPNLGSKTFDRRGKSSPALLYNGAK